MSDFSDPTPVIYAQDEDTGGSADDTSALNQESEAVVLDLNDPNLLLQEVTGADPTVNPYAAPPPPPDGFYRLKIKQIDTTDDKKQKVRFAVKVELSYPGGAGTPGVPMKTDKGEVKRYIATAIEGKIQDVNGKYDNVTVYDRFLDSRVNRQGGCPILHLLSALKVKIPPKYTLKTLMDLTNAALATEPEVDVQLAWEGNLSQEDADRIKVAAATHKEARRPRNPLGMHRFPQVDGKYVPDMQLEVPGVGKVNFHAQSKIIGYFPAGTKAKK